MIPRPTQLSGAEFLAARASAGLFDAPRVGKTGASIIAADYIMARSILVVTTASGRAVWRRGFADWSAFPRSVAIGGAGTADVEIVGWANIGEPRLRARLLERRWDLIIGDEGHYARSFAAKRTQAFYGALIDDGAQLATRTGIVHSAAVAWVLTGTPVPNTPKDLYPMLRALAPERLAAAGDLPDVTRQSDFVRRYCKTRPMKIGRGCHARYVDVVIEGRSMDELRRRCEGFGLARTQQDVGITAPVHELFPLVVNDNLRRQIDSIDADAVLDAAETGDTRKLDMHMGPLRRLTGEIKARAVVAAVLEELECGLDKIVLMAWHRETIRLLQEGLAKAGAVRLDGSSTEVDRAAAERAFRERADCRVFIGQIQAAGEAIDLSAASELMFVESSFVPKDMKQASLRITNHGQARQPRVRVAALEGSIDEALQAVLLRKWASIREIGL